MKPTRQQLEDELADAHEEIAALRDILAAAGECPQAAPWVIGYISQIGTSEFCEGNIPALRRHAERLRAAAPEASQS